VEVVNRPKFVIIRQIIFEYFVLNKLFLSDFKPGNNEKSLTFILDPISR
jgi:hypothetical protein